MSHQKTVSCHSEGSEESPVFDAAEIRNDAALRSE
jgi:hypothetical protein